MLSSIMHDGITQYDGTLCVKSLEGSTLNWEDHNKLDFASQVTNEEKAEVRASSEKFPKKWSSLDQKILEAKQEHPM